MSDAAMHVDDESLQFMHSTPVFNLGQQRRYEDLLKIGSEMKLIAAHFMSYSDLGQKMCLEFASLRRSFSRMEVMSADASVRPLGKLFGAVDRAFTSHFNDVAQKIVTELNGFVKIELEQLGILERDHQRLLKDFNSAQDEYTTLRPQGASSKKQKTEQSLCQSHTVASLAFFEFCQKMEGIELKLRSILPRTFLAFLTSVSGPFRDCLAAINDQEDLLNTAQTSIQTVDQRLLDFSQQSAETKQRLSSQIPIFWQRLKEPFTRTSVTSIQGYLWKKSGTLKRSWHKRFFMVSDGVLSWAKTIDEALRSQKSVPLLLCSIKTEPGAARANCFSITRKGMPPMILQALTSWDMEQWLAVIQNAVTSQLNADDDRLPPPSLTCDTVCADCGAANASWATVNWAMTLCDACAGEHRGLGSGVSRVRSLTLDDVEPMHRALVEAIGVEHGNAVLEAAITPDAKLADDASPEARRAFAEAKYRDRVWASDAADVDVIAAVQAQDLIAVFKCIAAGKHTEGEFSAIHAAAVVGNPMVLHLLLLNTPHAGRPDDGGWTPLCYAAWHDQAKMVDILLLYGAEFDRDGVNPWDIARSRNNEIIMAKLGVFAETSTFDAERSYDQPHDDVQPAPFEFERFVAEPAIYAPKSPIARVNAPRQSLNTVVSQMSARLSVRGARKDTLGPDEDEL